MVLHGQRIITHLLRDFRDMLRVLDAIEPVLAAAHTRITACNRPSFSLCFRILCISFDSVGPMAIGYNSPSMLETVLVTHMCSSHCALHHALG